MDQTFYTSLFALVATSITSIMGVLKFYFMLKMKRDAKKSELDLSVETFKATEAGKFVLALKAVVDRMEPVVIQHSGIMDQYGKAIKENQATEVKILEMGKVLSHQYENFQSRMNNVQAGGSHIIKELEGIKTEVLHLKSGNIFVRNKK